MKIRIFLLINLSLFLFSCYSKNTNKTTVVSEVAVSAKMDDIQAHMKLQERIELSENDTDTSHLYHYNDSDMNIALPLISEGLKKNGFKIISKDEFAKRIKYVFGDIFSQPNCRIQEHEKFYTLFYGKN